MMSRKRQLLKKDNKAGKDSEKGKRLDMIRWVAGFQGMALAAAATEASLFIIM